MEEKRRLSSYFAENTCEFDVIFVPLEQQTPEETPAQFVRMLETFLKDVFSSHHSDIVRTVIKELGISN
eukprot:m.230757 g.230757  ORF g.230757 m.230757 type:complete len:69 (+) comp22416_c16_seq1:809-1015(+)